LVSAVAVARRAERRDEASRKDFMA
jgi:hypothetical protein